MSQFEQLHLSGLASAVRELVHAWLSVLASRSVRALAQKYSVSKKAKSDAMIRKKKSDNKRKDREFQVFLCHSSNDKEKVRTLYRNLRNDGYIPWPDEEDLLPGMEWDVEIAKAVYSSNVVLVCLSNNSVSKTGFVQKEIKFALDKADEMPEGKIYIIPLKLEECEVPRRLARWQWVNLYENEGYAKLKRSLELCQEKSTSEPISGQRNMDEQMHSHPVSAASIHNLLLPPSQLEYLRKAIELGHPYFVDTKSVQMESALIEVEAFIRTLNFRPSTVRYSDIKLGEIRTFSTESGPRIVILVLLDEVFSGNGYSFFKALAIRPPGDLPLPSGIQIKPRWERIQSVVVLTNRDVIMALSERNREAFLEFYKST